MPAPIISSITSINALMKGRAWAFQPNLTPESDAATSWAATGLPDGLEIDVDTGLINGIPTVPGVYVVKLTATNSSGTSTPMVFPMGVENNIYLESPAVRVRINLQTGGVSGPFNTIPLYVKSGDSFAMAVGFEDGDGVLQDIPMLESITLHMKEYDDERVLHLSDGLAQKTGDYDSTQFLIWVDCTIPRLKHILSNWEDPQGTGFIGLGEFTWTWFAARPGFELPQRCTRTTQNFGITTFRELD